MMTPVYGIVHVLCTHSYMLLYAWLSLMSRSVDQTVSDVRRQLVTYSYKWIRDTRTCTRNGTLHPARDTCRRSHTARLYTGWILQIKQILH